MPTTLPQTVLLLLVIVLGVPLAGAIPETYTLRFSDVPPTSTLISHSERVASQAPANTWLDQQGWQQVWPPSLFGTQQRLPVRITVENLDGLLKPGMTVEVGLRVQ